MKVAVSTALTNLTPDPKPPQSPEGGNEDNTFAPLHPCGLCVKPILTTLSLGLFVAKNNL